jgi:hypothetical protein
MSLNNMLMLYPFPWFIEKKKPYGCALGIYFFRVGFAG